MLKLIVVPIIDEEEKVQGILYRSLDESIVYFPKNLKIPQPSGRVYQLPFNECLTPEGSFQSSTRDQSLRFLSLISDEQVIQESAEEMRDRVRLEGQTTLSIEWVIHYFSIPQDDRLALTKTGEEAVEELNKPPSSRYAKTPKGKLTQKRWRQSPQGQETLQRRREEKRIERETFNAAAKWLEENPGKTFQDWLEFQEKGE